MTDLIRLSCWCGIECAIPRSLYNECRKDPKTAWTCPIGHGNVYKESEADMIRRERDRLKQQLAQRDDTIEAERRSNAALRGVITKTMRRVGVTDEPNRNDRSREAGDAGSMEMVDVE